VFNFELISYIIILLMIFISISISFYFIRRIRNKSSKVEGRNYKAIGILEIIFGFVFMMISIILFVLVQKDINNTISILRPISAMTSEPIKLLLIALFLVGISILIIGINYIRFHKEMPSNT